MDAQNGESQVLIGVGRACMIGYTAMIKERAGAWRIKDSASLGSRWNWFIILIFKSTGTTFDLMDIQDGALYGLASDTFRQVSVHKENSDL